MLAVAAQSARLLAECAALDAMPTVALDVFGDADTRRAATRWLRIGSAATLQIDAGRLLETLAMLAREGGVQGWLVGSGFDGRADLLAQGAALLPLIGTAPVDVQLLQQPEVYFSVLQAHGIQHPPVQFTPPAEPDGWLRKGAGGCGGWQVERASVQASDPPDARHYWQQERSGTPMSATFVANGEDAVLLGFNLQTVQAIGTRPFVFSGVVGPVPVNAAVQRDISHAARTLTREYRLRGLCSIDFMLVGAKAEVLEVNARVPASVALYPCVGSGGPLRAHVAASLRGELPQVVPDTTVRGTQIVFARTPLRVGSAAAQWLAGSLGTHDLPRAGSRFAPGSPVCSLSMSGNNDESAAQVIAQLTQRCEATLQTLESTP